MAKKRGNNEGSIFLRKDGRWSAQVDLGWENGKRKRPTFYGRTRKEVADELNRALRDKAQGMPIAVERQTLEQFLVRWLADSVRPSVRPLTHEQYEQHVRLYINPELGKVQLSKLSVQQVQMFVNRLLKKEKKISGRKVSTVGAGKGAIDKDLTNEEAPRATLLSPRTVRITLFVLRRALAQAVKWGLAARNVADLVDRPKVERREIRPPTQDQVKRLLDALKGHRFEALFTVCLTLGLRRGEVLALRWDDIDLEKRTLSVTQALQRSGGKYCEPGNQGSKLRFVPPKSNRGFRTLAMPDCVVSLLRAHRAKQAQERLLIGSDWQDYGLAFSSIKGTPIEPRRADTEFKHILTTAELPDTIRLHDSRHFAATTLLAQGVHPRTVMEILGHSEIGLTMNTYSHVVPDLMRQAADKIDAAIGGR